MRKSVCILAFGGMLGLAQQSLALRDDEEGAQTLLAQEKFVQQCAYCDLKKYRFGRSRIGNVREQAFWVTQTPTGMQCEFWDDGSATSVSAFSIGVPGDAIPLFHTHPTNQARFSDQDRSEALRLEGDYHQGIDSYAMTGSKFGVIDPTPVPGQPLEAWYSNSLWLDTLSSTEKRTACDLFE